jgi:hypothetical protein
LIAIVITVLNTAEPNLSRKTAASQPIFSAGRNLSRLFGHASRKCLVHIRLRGLAPTELLFEQFNPLVQLVQKYSPELSRLIRDDSPSSLPLV